MHLHREDDGAGAVGLRTLIVGAGSAGAALARDLTAVPAFGLQPVGFVDDDHAKETVQGFSVLGRLTDVRTTIRLVAAEVVVLAIPALDPATMRWLADEAGQEGVCVRYLPSFVAALERDVRLSDLRTLQVGQLIGRQEMHVVSAGARETIEGQRVLVTGAGGSIGSELCRQVAGFGPARLFMLDHDESNLHRLQLELTGSGLLDNDDILIADIRDRRRMSQLFTTLRPDVVFHAAAHKHLPLLEKHPCEGVKSNVWGTQNVVQAALEADVDRFILISTDKAADPTSVLGATKRLAEILLRANAVGRTRFASVRFGNVLGSRGSLLSVLAAQLERGEAVTVTHPDVTRYFMTVEEAVGLVLEAGRMARDGEIFVLDMGEPVRIIDLVNNYATQVHTRDLQVRYTGLRQGEKLNEALFSEQEDCRPTEHPKIFSTISPAIADDFAEILNELYAAAVGNEAADVRTQLMRLVAGYTSASPVSTPVLAAPYPDGF